MTPDSVESTLSTMGNWMLPMIERREEQSHWGTQIAGTG